MPHLPGPVRHFVHDLFDKKDKKHDGSTSNKPGKTTSPPAPEKNGSDTLVNKLEDLNLEDRQGKHSKSEFVGGFKQGPANPDAGQASPTSIPPPFPTPAHQTVAPPAGPDRLPRPPQMFFPVPEHYKPSRTMQYALSGLGADAEDPVWLELDATSKPPKPPKLPSRPHSEESPRKDKLSASPPRPQITRPVSSPPLTPKSSKKSSSGESTPDRKAGSGRSTPSKSTQQCSAFTKSGQRCKNKVKTGLPLNVVDPDLSLEVFCHRHRTEILTRNTGFNSRRTDVFVEYSKYIPEYLHTDTQAALRSEMERPPSESDEPGYIYCFEIRDPDMPYAIKLKVGRTVTLQGRLHDWAKQCGSKEQVLRGWWPGNIADKDLQTSLMPGRIQSGEKGRYCHKLERLVHLELADLVVHTPYLNRGFPNISISAEDGTRSRPGTPSKNGKKANNSATALNNLQQGNKPCPDCGSMHKEIFPFLRPDDGPFRGQEWEKLVKPVIEKWGWFVETLA